MSGGACGYLAETFLLSSLYTILVHPRITGKEPACHYLCSSTLMGLNLSASVHSRKLFCRKAFGYWCEFFERKSLILT